VKTPIACATALALALAIAVASGAHAASLHQSALQVTTNARSASVSFQTSLPATARVAYGLAGQAVLWSAPEQHPSIHHSITLPGLNSGTSYQLTIESRSGNKLASVQTTVRTTLYSGSTKASLVKGALAINGQPLFPIIAWAQCASDYTMEEGLGINTFLAEYCLQNGHDNPTSIPNMSAALAGRAYAMPQAQSHQTGPGIIGYVIADEPDASPQSPPSSLPSLPSPAQSGLIRELNVTNHYAAYDIPPPVGPKSLYKDYFAKADMVGVDFYPLAHACDTGVEGVFEEQRALQAQNVGKPTYQWIEVNNLEGICPNRITAATANAEAWSIIAGGGNGIAWFSYGWPGGQIQSWYPGKVGGDQIKATDAAIQGIAPALLSTIRPAVSTSGPIKVGARRYNGASYVIAVNPSPTAATATITMPTLAANSKLAGSVYNESRSVSASKAGAFKDSFAPFAVHVYVFSPK
jgi:hypothetical protein